jgi:hypothetical protein
MTSFPIAFSLLGAGKVSLAADAGLPLEKIYDSVSLLWSPTRRVNHPQGRWMLGHLLGESVRRWQHYWPPKR